VDSIYRRLEKPMDLVKNLPADAYTEESDPESWNSDHLSGKNRAEEIQRFLNLMWNKDRLRDEASVKFDLISNTMSYEIDDEERSTLFSSNRNGTGQHNPRVTLADQFTWGAVVCAGVFIVVFVCVMAAWWVHKVTTRTSLRIPRIFQYPQRLHRKKKHHIKLDNFIKTDISKEVLNSCCSFVGYPSRTFTTIFQTKIMILLLYLNVLFLRWDDGFHKIIEIVYTVQRISED